MEAVNYAWSTVYFATVAVSKATRRLFGATLAASWQRSADKKAYPA